MYIVICNLHLVFWIFHLIKLFTVIFKDVYIFFLFTFFFFGIPEEIFSSTIAHWWSHKSNYLCFAQFNDTMVPKYQYPIYKNGNQYYGKMQSIPYPKVNKFKILQWFTTDCNFNLCISFLKVIWIIFLKHFEVKCNLIHKKRFRYKI